jgi:chorismate mutase
LGVGYQGFDGQKPINDAVRIKAVLKTVMKIVVRIKHIGEHEITTIKITMIDNNKNKDDFA